MWRPRWFVGGDLSSFLVLGVETPRLPRTRSGCDCRLGSIPIGPGMCCSSLCSTWTSYHNDGPDQPNRIGFLETLWIRNVPMIPRYWNLDFMPQCTNFSGRSLVFVLMKSASWRESVLTFCIVNATFCIDPPTHTYDLCMWELFFISLEKMVVNCMRYFWLNGIMSCIHACTAAFFARWTSFFPFFFDAFYAHQWRPLYSA